MADQVRPEEHSSQGTSAYTLASDIIQSAIADASRIRLEAVRAAEQMYDEIVRSAYSRAEEIVAEAREESWRIQAEAERRTATQASFSSFGADAALETLRVELAAMVRHLRNDLGGEVSEMPDAGLSSGLSPLSQTAAIAADGLSGISRGQNGSHDDSLPRLLARKDAPPGVAGEHNQRHPEADTSWRPPDWMSS